ncbi:nuclear factor 7, brain [Salmo salar]|uniref:Nuclear factor 7, brain n=1 Tax=Salmo salar TaxID=8030 RepID=A0A1S3N7W6_SALSA|nr:nuclear factor 7, brain [Salmo salar]|eukprot:XP_014011156.1 PREDICTED: nuclear factor 7, brain-like [Salmo salar]
MESFKMKSILKVSKLNSQLKLESSTQSQSIGAVRWNLPEEDLQAHSSAPTSPRKSSTPSTRRSSQHPHQNGMKNLRSLQECVRFINHWKEQVAQVCKSGSDAGKGTSKGETPVELKTERSLEESRKLIVLWANELNSVDKLAKARPWVQERCEKEEEEEENKDGEKDPDEEVQQRIMEWAKELQRASESCGVQSNELGNVLRLLGLRKKRLINLLPLLEFITWSLLKEDCKGGISQLWLSAKQRTWKAGTPRYIPNSVWNWMISASADVTFDPMTNHLWLQLSDDHRKVQEGMSESNLPFSPQRFDAWPGVLGWEGYASGRHYWEVDIANNGYWRVGLTTASAKRHGRFPMSPQTGYWTLWRSMHQFYACTKPETPLPLGLVARRMGIYLDYEEGQISFYNAETKTHIYTFTGTFKEKLYPVFAPLDGRALITIISPHKVSTL